MNTVRAALILGVNTDASLQRIKEKYRELAGKYHPDTPKGCKNKFQEISEAYEVLKKRSLEPTVSAPNLWGFHPAASDTNINLQYDPRIPRVYAPRKPYGFRDLLQEKGMIVLFLILIMVALAIFNCYVLHNLYLQAAEGSRVNFFMKNNSQKISLQYDDSLATRVTKSSPPEPLFISQASYPAQTSESNETILGSLQRHMNDTSQLPLRAILLNVTSFTRNQRFDKCRHTISWNEAQKLLADENIKGKRNFQASAEHETYDWRRESVSSLPCSISENIRPVVRALNCVTSCNPKDFVYTDIDIIKDNEITTNPCVIRILGERSMNRTQRIVLST